MIWVSCYRNFSFFHFYLSGSLSHPTWGEWANGCMGLSYLLGLNHNRLLTSLSQTHPGHFVFLWDAMKMRGEGIFVLLRPISVSIGQSLFWCCSAFSSHSEPPLQIPLCAWAHAQSEKDATALVMRTNTYACVNTNAAFTVVNGLMINGVTWCKPLFLFPLCTAC